MIDAHVALLDGELPAGDHQVGLVELGLGVGDVLDGVVTDVPPDDGARAGNGGEEKGTGGDEHSESHSISRVEVGGGRKTVKATSCASLRGLWVDGGEVQLERIAV